MTEPHPTIAQLQRVIADCQHQIRALQDRLTALEAQGQRATAAVETLQRARLHEPARECRGCGAGRGCACE